MNSYVARDVLTVARVTEDGQSFEDLGIMERKAGQLIIKCQSYEQLSPSHEALCARIDELCAEVEAEKQRNAKLFEAAEKWMAKAAHYEAENAKLRNILAHAVMIADLYEGLTNTRLSLDGGIVDCDWLRAWCKKLGIEVPS